MISANTYIQTLQELGHDVVEGGVQLDGYMSSPLILYRACPGAPQSEAHSGDLLPLFKVPLEDIPLKIALHQAATQTHALNIGGLTSLEVWTLQARLGGYLP